MNATNPMNPAHASTRTLTIELLALDLNTCGRCTGTDANLESAIETVAHVLREADVEVVVRKTVVATATQAKQLRFASSPTIRINGRDIALELRESNCGDCADLCACDGQVDCRVWVWQGREYTEAPKPLIIDAILRAYGEAWKPPPKSTASFRLPENLRRFFEAAAQKSQVALAAKAAKNGCCDRTACCDENEKEACCGEGAGAGADVGAAAGEHCGCQG